MKDFLQFIDKIFTTDIELGTLKLPFNSVELLISVVLPITIAIIIYKLLKRWTYRTISKSKIKDDKKEKVFNVFRLIYRITILIYIVLLIASKFGTQINDSIGTFGTFLTTPFVDEITITTLLLIIPLLYLGQFMGNIAQRFASNTLFPYMKLDAGIKQTLTAVIKNVIFGIVVLMGLPMIGIDLTILFGLFGILGIGLGFGLQGVVANLFAGIVILTSKPVKVGDHIIVDGTEGNLKEVRILNSVVSTITHESIIIPNSKLIDNPVHNFSFDDISIIIKCSVQVSYDSDLDKGLEILEDIGRRSPYTLEGKEIKTRVVSFDDSGISLQVISWIKDSAHKYDAESWINLEIWRTFKDNSIEIPYPQLDLKIKR